MADREKKLKESLEKLALSRLELAKTSKWGGWVALFWTGILILFLRGFVVEPFKIPSGSMIPTLLIGDHLFVAKSTYDIGVPFTNIPLITVSEPKRGDVIVFEYPNTEGDPSKEGQYYIKRLIGLPGDHISVRGGFPVVNNAKAVLNRYELADGEIPGFYLGNSSTTYRHYKEILPGDDNWHWVQRRGSVETMLDDWRNSVSVRGEKDCIDYLDHPYGGDRMALTRINEVCEFIIPEGNYFVMGDNRDESSDGRDWGLVERKLLKGRALFIWMSRNVTPSEYSDGHDDGNSGFFRLSRFGQGIR